MVCRFGNTVGMPREPDPFGIDYASELLHCFEGEVAGAAYFAALAAWHDGLGRDALQRFSEVERITAAALHPIVQRRGLVAADAEELRRRGEANAASERALTWDGLVGEMCEHYPRYVLEFERLLTITPVEDRAAVQLLVDHEAALAAAADRLRSGSTDALAPVEQFIASARPSS